MDRHYCIIGKLYCCIVMEPLFPCYTSNIPLVRQYCLLIHTVRGCIYPYAKLSLKLSNQIVLSKDADIADTVLED